MDTSWDEARRSARPGDLPSLRRLERDLHAQGWRHNGRSPREWLSALLLLPKYDYDTPYPTNMLAEAGLVAVPALVDALRTRHLDAHGKRDTRIRLECVEALTRIEPAPTCAIPALLESLHSPSSTLRRHVLWTLGKLQPRPTPLAIRELLTCLGRKSDPEERAQAARTLSKLDGPLPSEVRLAALSRLTDPSPPVRRYALRILERLPVPDAEVCTALEEQIILDDAHRFEALRILVRFDAPRALALLEEELELARRSKTEERGGQALLLITRLGAEAAPLLPALCRITTPPLAGPPVEIAVDAIVRAQRALHSPPAGPPARQDARARLLLSPLPPAGPTERPAAALARWASAFLPHGRELCVRIALAAARRAMERWDAHYFLNTATREGLFALEDWVCAPSPEAATRASGLCYIVPSQLSAPDAFSAAWSLTYAGVTGLTGEERARWEVHTPPLQVEGGYLGSAVYTACRCLQGASVVAFAINAWGGPETEPLSAEHAVQEVHRAIVDDVLPWVLGSGDPVREVHQRRRELLAAPPGTPAQ